MAKHWYIPELDVFADVMVSVPSLIFSSTSSPLKYQMMSGCGSPVTSQVNVTSVFVSRCFMSGGEDVIIAGSVVRE